MFKADGFTDSYHYWIVLQVEENGTIISDFFEDTLNYLETEVNTDLNNDQVIGANLQEVEYDGVVLSANNKPKKDTDNFIY